MQKSRKPRGNAQGTSVSAKDDAAARSQAQKRAALLDRMYRRNQPPIDGGPQTPPTS
ncbi:hypothetical protein [Streptomyces sp. AJS327]|uniref:hypothetical protein n=1 Tax=Streptomyces sp. AJS327 TaxID=2545265 RepID=UPI0015DDD48D|nr:hypothetical protein [Streptomyces sp. AJS327]